MNKTKPLLFAAGFVLTMALALSCSSDSSSSGAGTCDANFRTETIGTQTWMAENLNCNVGGSKCYDNNPANCAKYGRLYDWSTAMALPASCNSSDCSSQIQSKHRGICPAGWHIPSGADWMALSSYVESDSGCRICETSNLKAIRIFLKLLPAFPNCTTCDASKLKAMSGWNSNGNGTDQYGFSALPGGYRNSDGSFVNVGDYGFWWSANEDDSYYAYGQYMRYGSDGAGWYYYEKSYLFSVRCIQD